VIAELLLYVGPTTDIRIITDVTAVVASANANSASPQPSAAAVPAKPAPHSADPEAPHGAATVSLAASTENSQFSPTDTRIMADITAEIGSVDSNSASAEPSVAAAPSRLTPKSIDPGASHGVTTVPLAASAENSQSFETLRVPNSVPAKPIRLIGVEATPPRESWLTLSNVQHGAATRQSQSNIIFIRGSDVQVQMYAGENVLSTRIFLPLLEEIELS
jgi:hypothetical protein